MIRRIAWSIATLWLALGLPLVCRAFVVYHLDANQGDDDHSGLLNVDGQIQAWRTLNRLGRASLKAGDVVLFRRGGRWVGTLSLDSGVTYASYGSGPLPLIAGSEPLVSARWEREQGNVYVTPLNLLGREREGALQVFYDDASGRTVALQRARHPNVGQGAYGPGSRYLKASAEAIENANNGNNASTDTLFTEPGVVPAGADMSQAEAFVRNDTWVVTRYTVESVRNRRVKVKPVGFEVLGIRPTWGYWLENARWMLDSPGEWFFDKTRGTLHVWMPDGQSPSAKRLRVAVVKHGIWAKNVHAFTVKDLAIVETASDSVRIEGASRDFLLEGLKISHAGANGMLVTDSQKGTIRNVAVLDSRENAISLGDFRFTPHVIPSRDVDILNVTVRNSGLGYYAHGAVTLGDGGQLQGSVVENSNYIAVHAWKNNVIRGNRITGACLELDDCGAVYTISRHGGRHGYPLNVSIDGNLIDSKSSRVEQTDAARLDGRPGARAYTETRGVYLDDDSTSVSVTNNTISGYDEGALLHLACGNSLSGNVIFGNRVTQLWMQQNDPAHTIKGNVINDNLFIGDAASSLLILNNSFGGVDGFAQFSRNQYFSQGGNQPFIEETPQGTKVRSLVHWLQISDEKGSMRSWPWRPLKASNTGNLINGQFEQGNSGWATWGLTLKRADSDSRHCVRVQADGSQTRPNGVAFGIFNTTQPFAIKRGQTYMVQFDAKADKPGSVVDVGLRNTLNDYADASTAQALELSQVWRTYQAAVTAIQSLPQGARLDLAVSGLGAVCLDRVSLSPWQTQAMADQGNVRVLSNGDNVDRVFSCPDTKARCDAYLDARTNLRVSFPVSVKPRQSRVLVIPLPLP